MTVSLPVVWIVGHFAVVTGLALAVWHLCTRARADAVGGVLGALFVGLAGVPTLVPWHCVDLGSIAFATGK